MKLLHRFVLLLILLILLYVLSTRAKTSTGLTALVPTTIQTAHPPTSVTYYVKNTKNGIEAAYLLHHTREKLLRVVQYLARVDDSEIPTNLRAGIKRLVHQHLNNINLAELDARRAQTIAYNREKGQSIHICLRKCEDCDALGESDRVFLVALHELSHSAMLKFEPNENGITLHGQEYLEYETFMIDTAEKLGIINYAAVVGKPLCGILLPDTRLTKI